MPAVAITDHGVLYGVVDSTRRRAGQRHQADPRLRGLRRHRQPARPQGRTGREPASHHLVLLAENEPGYHNLDPPGLRRAPRGLLLQAAHRQGAAGAAPRGADRPVRLPEGRGRRRPRRRTTSTAAAQRRRASTRRSSARTTSSSSCRTTACPSSATANRAHAGGRRAAPACRWWPPTTCTTSRRSTPRRTRCCSACRRRP